MPSVVDTGSFNPENPFLQKLFDVAGDKTLHDLTGHTTPDESKGEQRTIFAKTVEGLKCLKGHKIVGTILGELEAAKTNRDFLEAMKRIEPLVRRVRQTLVEAQVLEWSSDSLSPLVVRRHEPTQPVSALEKLQGDTTIKNNAGIFFINNILPILGARRDGIERRAHLVGEGVYREEKDFPAGFYGAMSDTASQKRKSITNPSLGLWRGVQFERNSKGRLLLELCFEGKPGDIIPSNTISEKLYPGKDPAEVEKALYGTISNILGKFDKGKAPFSRLKSGTGIMIGEEDTIPEPVEATSDSGGFAMDADFLDQPLDTDTVSLVSPPKVSPAPAPISASVSTELSVDMVDALKLSVNAAKVLKYFILKPDTSIQLGTLVTESGAEPTIVINIAKLIEEINKEIHGKTTKTVQKRGNMILFTATA